MYQSIQQELNIPYLQVFIFKFQLSSFKFSSLFSSKAYCPEAILPTLGAIMSPSKKKAAKPKDVSPESNPPDELPKFALPNDENKLFEKEDDVGLSTIHELSIANEEGEEEEVTPTKVWYHAIDTLFKLSTANVDRKVSENGFNTKVWTPWNNFMNGIRGI